MKEKYKKIEKVILAVILILLTAIVLCFLWTKLDKNKPVFIAGYSFFIVSSASMEPNYPVHSLVVIKKAPLSGLEVGDVVVYRADALGGGLAFHRIVRFGENGGEFFTKGDNNAHEDNQLINEKTYIGKGVYKNKILGEYIFSIQNPVGFVAFFVVPLFFATAFIYFLRRILVKKTD